MTSKVALRREQTRQSLQSIAARHFASKGPAAVSVEEIIAEANISRRTFYTFFTSKHELMAAIVVPVFEDGLGQLQALEKQPGNRLVEKIINVYLALWEQHSDAFFLSTQLDEKTFTLVEAPHNDFVFALLGLLQKAEKAGSLRNNSADYSLKLVARCALPILKIYAEDKNLHSLYRDTMLGLLTGD